MKYKVGDKVRIIDKDNGCLTHSMRKYLGTVMTIKSVSYGCYHMVEDQADVLNGWLWKEELIAGYATETFTKFDLKNGDVVKCSNGVVYIINKDLSTLIGKNGYVKLSEYLTDLTNKIDAGWNIVAVRRPVKDYECQFTAFERSHGVLVYERVEPEEMTLAEVCKLLGKQIKIIP